MLFYRIKGLTEAGTQPEEYETRRGRRADAEHASEIAMKINKFNSKLGDKSFFFVAEEDVNAFKLGAIVSENIKFEKHLKAFEECIGFDVREQMIDEIRICDIINLLSMSCRYDYIEDDDLILERFGLDRLRHMRMDFKDVIIDRIGKKEQYDSAEIMLAGDAVRAELDRIYAVKARAGSYGHPVHYLIRTDDRDTEETIKRVILSALYSNGRLKSRRVSFTGFGAFTDVSGDELARIYQAGCGGTVVMRYAAPDDVDDDRAFGECHDTLDKLCAVMKANRNDVLTVFSLPRSCETARQTIYESLGSVGIVEIAEDFAYEDRARAFLKMLAKNSGVRTDKTLFKELEPDRGYLTPELREIFNRWYDGKLRNTIYPQYSEISPAHEEIAEAKPKGSAIEELESMIGLDEAKSIIYRALDFYKAQKLFADKGMNTARTSMHMLFAGNPGTAKTTVARLFTKIMRDNGILSKGTLVEVGRGDLVGKYVGWTAPTIKKKFREAKGGVLFIDEAYSLVDDRDGSYGDEAINTIVQEMENHRDDVIVIFAGYPDKMNKFLDKNPGLRSRIAFHVYFDDYSPDELCQIAALTASKNGLIIEEGALDKLRLLFEHAVTQPDFGNGRFVRSVIEQARMAQAQRLVSLPYDDVTIGDIAAITEEDIVLPVPDSDNRPNIGF